MAAAVGALVLARALDDSQLSDEIVASVRERTIIPAERGCKLAEEPSSYDADMTDLLNDPPMS